MRAWPALAALALLAACDGRESPTATAGGARQEPYVAVPAGTAPRGAAAYAAALAPPGPPVTPALLEAGRHRYAVFCTPCHGTDGAGNGPVVRRGFPRPLPFGTQALDAAQIVEVITHGKGAMYPFAERIAPVDRWAIAHHVRRLGRVDR